MFKGSIPPDLQKIVSEVVGTWSVEDVQIACSGNLTIERILAVDGKFRLHGNDVTCYTCCLGSAAAGQPFWMQVKDEHREEWGWLEEWMDTPEKQVATVMLATRMLEGFDRPPNPYYKRMETAYRTQWSDLHRQTLAKVEKGLPKLSSFFVGDARDRMGSIPREYAVVSYPPFFTGGYEKMWEQLDKLFDWDKPNYEIMDDQGVQELIEMIMDRPNWMFGVPEKIDGLEDHLHGMAQTTLRGVPLYSYASTGPTRIVTPMTKTAQPMLPLLAPGDELGDDIKLVVLSLDQFRHIRSQFLATHIAPAGSAIMCCAVQVGGKIVGAFSFDRPSSVIGFAGRILEPYVYLMSDFVVSNSQYKRLGKLVLTAVCSNEARMLAERSLGRQVRSIVTTAFSDHPESMKYRGLFKLIGRGEQSEGKKYVLNYGSEAGRWTLEEGLKEWKKKHGQTK